MYSSDGIEPIFANAESIFCDANWEAASEIRGVLYNASADENSCRHSRFNFSNAFTGSANLLFQTSNSSSCNRHRTKYVITNAKKQAIIKIQKVKPTPD